MMQTSRPDSGGEMSHAQDPLNIDPIYRHGAEKYHVFGPYYALTPLEIK